MELRRSLERCRDQYRVDIVRVVSTTKSFVTVAPLARRTARLCGYPQKFADMMLRSMPFIEVVDRLRESVACIV